MKDRKLNKVLLSKSHPHLAREWHPTKNGNLTPFDVTAGSHKKVWWKCSKGDDHEWLQAINTRVRSLEKNKNRSSECLVCLKRVAVPSNCLKTTHPDLIREWDYEKNNELKIFPQNVTEISRLKVSWICKNNSKHQWKAVIRDRIKGGKKKKGSGCPYCSGKIITEEKCLAITHPELSKEWHPTKNEKKTPYDFSKGSDEKVWWKCPKGEDHEWDAVISSRVGGRSCPICLNRRLVLSNRLSVTHPLIASQWNFEKNYPLTPDDVTGGSTKKVFWKCPNGDDHIWRSQINSRVIRNSPCPCCSGRKTVGSNSLAILKPDIAAEWYPTKNDKQPNQIRPGSSYKAIWVCKNNSEHEWEAAVSDRVDGHGCPYCNLGWTIDKIKLFISSILPYIDSLSPAELYVIFQQNGLLTLQKKGKSFIQAFKAGKFPKNELEKFVKGEQSQIDSYISSTNCEISNQENQQDELKCISEENISEKDEEFPIIETKDVLALIDNKIVANIDKEAIDFFINSAVAKIWRHIFLDETSAITQLNVYKEGFYAEKVKLKFLDQYNGAKNLIIPSGYNFRINENLILPNLMQCFTAYMVQKTKRFGNWSGTGAGKTLSAILSSRVICAEVSIICCPNSVVEGWKRNIESIYPDSIIITKDLKQKIIPDRHNYIILNYEFFQQDNSESKLNRFLQHNKVDFVIIDEVHFSKQRFSENISKRKKVISAMLSEGYKKNENIHVLGMSATPVINNLFEGKSLIELITGLHHDELSTTATIPNCIAIYQKFVSHGLRWMPKYNQKITVSTIEVDCSPFIDEIKKLNLKNSMVDLEAILTKAKIPEILKNIKPKTIVYTHYLKNILVFLQDEIDKAGWKSAVYSGDDKTGLEEFIKGDTDVLIATSCLSTGVDGLQTICNRIIVNTLPWTHAEFEQLKGRIYRQGQQSDHVDIIVPLTYSVINQERWSWCDSRWKRIQFKKSIADAAVDGIIPEGHLRTPAQAYQDTMKWLERLDNEGVHEIERKKIDISISDQKYEVRLRKFGDFSKMNHRLNSSSSFLTHERFLKDPEEWKHYHALYREARKDWAVTPYQEAIKWCKARPHLIIGDFGCGEALIAKELDNKFYSLDHVAINDDVIACDLAYVPLDDESLDAVIFSLSLMGANFTDYLYEAHRCLKLDGTLWIAEATSRFKDLEGFLQGLEVLGFDVVNSKKKGDFIFIRAIKSDRMSRKIEVRF